MRLKKSKNAAEEDIIRMLNDGYRILNWLKSDYAQKKQNGTFNATTDHQRYNDVVNDWGQQVVSRLMLIFPTELEANQFLHPPVHFGNIAADTADDYKS